MELIIKELCDTQFVENYTKKCLKIISNIVETEEAIQYIWVETLNYIHRNEEKVLKYYSKGGINQVRKLISGLIVRQICSKTSPFYFQYIKKSSDNVIRTLSENNKYDEVNGWAENYKKTEKTVDDFKTLSIEYNENYSNSHYINALNDLSDEDRSILITYIANNNKISTTAKQLKVSSPYLKNKLNEIKNNYLNKLKKYE